LTKTLSVIGWYPNPFEDPPPIPYHLEWDQKNARFTKHKPPTNEAKREKRRVMIAPEGNEHWNPDSDDFAEIMFQGGEKHPQIAGEIYTLLETIIRTAYGSNWIAMADKAAKAERDPRVNYPIERLNIFTHANKELTSLLGNIDRRTGDVEFGNRPEGEWKAPGGELPPNPSWLDYADKTALDPLDRETTLDWLANKFASVEIGPRPATKGGPEPPKGKVTRAMLQNAFSRTAQVFVFACEAGATKSGRPDPTRLQSLAEAFNVAVTAFSKPIRYKFNVKDSKVTFKLSLVEPDHGPDSPDLTKPDPNFRNLESLALARNKDFVVKIPKPGQPQK
jgi:hypothetical protein